MGIDVGYLFDDSNRIVRKVDSEHGVMQYVPPSGVLFPRELDRLLQRHPRLPEQSLARHVYKQHIMHLALPLWKRGLLRCVATIPEFVLQATVQLIATVSSSLVVFLHLFVFRPLLVPYIQSYYMLTFVAWLLAFAPVLAVICYVVYDAVYQRRCRCKNRIGQQVEMVIADVPRIEYVVDRSDSCPEVAVSFEVAPPVYHGSRRPSLASSRLRDGEQRGDQCGSSKSRNSSGSSSSSSSSSSMSCNEINSDEEDGSMSSSETDSTQSHSSKHVDGIEYDAAAAVF
jgi:hypothetical protein